MAKFQLHCLHSVIPVILHSDSSCTTAEIQQPEPTITANRQRVWDDFGIGMLMLELLFAQKLCFSMSYDVYVENTDTSCITCVQQRYSNQLTIKMRWHSTHPSLSSTPQGAKVILNSLMFSIKFFEILR